MDSQARPKLAVLAVVVVGVIGMGIALWQGRARPQSPKAVVEIVEPKAGQPASGGQQAFETGAESSGAAIEPAASVVVHVAGHVKKPGVYTLPGSARVIDAVKAAGGSKASANLDAINLAAKLNDGEQIYVPTGTEAVATNGRADARGASTSAAPAARAQAASSPAGPTRVNVNIAGLAELDRLPGVGPAIAQRIIDYRRAAGGFARPEDLMNVQGIGEKTFARMRAWVAVR